MPGGIETTPRDELTGQPLSMYVRPADFHIEGLDCTPEFHHQQHPGNDLELGRDDAGDLLHATDPNRSEGLAVRYSKGQIVPNWLHDAYHDLFFGPKLPNNSVDKHRTVLFGLGKVIPLQAIQIYEPGAYKLVDISWAEHDFIRRTTHYEGANHQGWRYNRRGRIGTYLADYALKNFLPEIIWEKDVALQVERFIELHQDLSNPRNLRWEVEESGLMKGQPTLKQLKQKQLLAIGESIVHRAIMLSAESSRPLFQEAIKAGMVQGTKRDLGQLAIKFFGTRTDYASTLVRHIDNVLAKPLRAEENEAVEIAA